MADVKKLPEALYPGEIRVIPNDLGYSARVQVRDGYVYFNLTELSFARQSIDGVLEIEVDTKTATKQPFFQRIDLRSSSAIRALVTELNNAFGGKKDELGFNWSLILNGVAAELSRAIKKSQRPEYLVGVPFTEPSFLLMPFLQEGSPNLLFAQSEAGKTWLALRMGVSLITGQEFLGFTAPKGKKILFVDYEDVKSTFSSRLHKICAGAKVKYDDIAAQFPYYKPLGSVKENVEIMRKIVIEEKIDLVIIDAGGDAAGGSPSDEEKVLELFNALDSINVTKLILHHEPKSVVNESAAFYGSMYWKARTRVGWRLEVESEENGMKLVKASIQKRSNLPYIEPIYYKMHFNATTLDEVFNSEEKSVLIPATKFEVVTLAQIQKDKPTALAIVESLEKQGTLTIGQLSAFVFKDPSVVGKVLREELLPQGIVEQVKDGRSTIWKLKTT